MVLTIFDVVQTGNFRLDCAPDGWVLKKLAEKHGKLLQLFLASHCMLVNLPFKRVGKHRVWLVTYVLLQVLVEFAHFGMELLDLLHFLKNVDELFVHQQKFLLEKFVLGRLGHRANLGQEGVQVRGLINEVGILRNVLWLEGANAFAGSCCGHRLTLKDVGALVVVDRFVSEGRQRCRDTCLAEGAVFLVNLDANIAVE